MPKFGKKEAVATAWNIFKANWVFLLVITAISMAIGYLPTAVSGYFSQQPYVSIIISIVFWLAGIVISIGTLKIMLNLVDGKTASFTDLFLYWKLIIKYLLVQILTGMIVLVGLILLVIPGIIFGIRLQLAAYLVIDRNLGPIEAIKRSWGITGGSTLNLLLLDLVIGLIFFAGILALGVGLLAAIPISGLSMAWVYRKLSSVS